MTRVAVGIFVREHGTLRLQHRDGHEVLARDHLERGALTVQLLLQHLGDLGIDLGEGLVEDGFGARDGGGGGVGGEGLGQGWLLRR